MGLSFFPTIYYTTESTPCVSKAAGLHCAPQLYQPVLNTSNIHYYRFSYKNKTFPNLFFFFFYISVILFFRLVYSAFGKHRHLSYYSGILFGCIYSMWYIKCNNYVHIFFLFLLGWHLGNQITYIREILKKFNFNSTDVFPPVNPIVPTFEYLDQFIKRCGRSSMLSQQLH